MCDEVFTIRLFQQQDISSIRRYSSRAPRIM